jgi:hypothetical protein
MKICSHNRCYLLEASEKNSAEIRHFLKEGDWFYRLIVQEKMRRVMQTIQKS